MKPSYTTTFTVGAVSGLILALSLFTYFAAAGAVRSFTAELEGSDVIPSFASSASATWYLAILSGLIGGAIIAVGARAASRVIDPETSGGSLWLVIPLGGTIAAIIAMVVLPLGVTVLGTISEGNAIIGIGDMVILVAIAGITAGGVVASLATAISRPTVPTDDPELLTV